MATFSVFRIHVDADARGFVAFIAPLDGGVHVLARSICPSRVRTLGQQKLREFDQGQNRQGDECHGAR